MGNLKNEQRTNKGKTLPMNKERSERIFITDPLKRERTKKILDEMIDNRRRGEVGVYYINGKKYDTRKADLMCDYHKTIDLWQPDTEKLYRTKNGAYFLMSDHKGVIDVMLLDEKKALAFMNAHPAGIITDNYDKVFGSPEEG